MNTRATGPQPDAGDDHHPAPQSHTARSPDEAPGNGDPSSPVNPQLTRARRAWLGAMEAAAPCLHTAPSGLTPRLPSSRTSPGP